MHTNEALIVKALFVSLEAPFRPLLRDAQWSHCLARSPHQTVKCFHLRSLPPPPKAGLVSSWGLQNCKPFAPAAAECQEGAVHKGSRAASRAPSPSPAPPLWACQKGSSRGGRNRLPLHSRTRERSASLWWAQKSSPASHGARWGREGMGGQGLASTGPLSSGSGSWEDRPCRGQEAAALVGSGGGQAGICQLAAPLRSPACSLPAARPACQSLTCHILFPL